MVDTSVAFGMAPSAGAFGYLIDTANEIFRHQSFRLLVKWVNDHVFVRLPRFQLRAYN